MIPTIDQYLDLAKERSGIQSDRGLARTLKVQPATVNHWRTKRSIPSDALMINLARLAKEDETLALIVLNSWRSTGQPSIKYLELAHKISAMVITLFLLFSILPASQSHAAPLSGNSGISVYYGKLIIIQKGTLILY